MKTAEEILSGKPALEYAAMMGPGSGTKYLKWEDALDAMLMYEKELNEDLKTKLEQLELDLANIHDLISKLYH